MKDEDASVKKMSSRELAHTWREVELGRASAQEKIDLACQTAEAGATRFISQLRELLRDEDSEVRYYALQSLVLDLKQKGSDMASICWELLEEDPDEDVRSMATACLGSIYFGSRDRRVFRKLTTIAKDSKQPEYVRWRAYGALFKIAGRPPSEWPGFRVSWRELDQVQIDWAKVAELEDSLDAVNESG